MSRFSAKASSGGRRRVRAMPADETFPGSGWPPANTTNVTGNQGTTQYRPDNIDDTKFNLGHPVNDVNHAVWTQSPGTLQYPMVINDAGGATGDGHNTWHYGGEIQGTDATLGERDVQYAHTSGIEHCNDGGGYSIADTMKITNIGDGYRFTDSATTAWLKRIYCKDLRDGFVEFDEMTGNAVIYDCLVEGCYSGFSDIGSGTNSGNTLTVDGVLMWLKPTVDTDEDPGTGTWCGGTGGCPELNGVWSDGRFRGSNGIWEGDSGSFGTVVVRNSWFRMDRTSAWGPAPMKWPGQSGAQWNNSTALTIGPNVKMLWTGASKTLVSGEIAAGANSYPSTLPSGVELITGQAALDKWNKAAAAWKKDHGY